MEVKVDFLLNIYLHNNYIALTYENIIYLERIPLLKAYHDDDYSKKNTDIEFLAQIGNVTSVFTSVSFNINIILY